jgi:CubicO group peptidase (beta-lactamase class C family)
MKNNLKTLIILLGIMLLSLGTNRLSAQILPDSTLIKINSFYSTWDKIYSPGCAVGIVRNDSLIFAKGYGMANLEYSVPNSPETIFHMASISKQFTAYSILLLEKQGKLQLDDDIRKYLPWFPDLKEKITIRNLLNHTSGIRDQWQLLAISGTRLDDVITQDHIIKILGRQKALNFKPGDKYSYSNSGFTMLAEIVRSITGKSLRQFTDSAIFKPLGMMNTHFHDDYEEIVKNRSYSYQRKDSIHFTNSILSYSNAGATSLFTNITDMSKWIMNFYDPKVGDLKDIARLTQNGKLNNGKDINYALGIVSDKYRGWRQYSHGGSDAGYRTYITVFPDLKMGFIVFSNLGDFNTGGLTYQMVNLFINDTTKQSLQGKQEKRDTTAALLKDISSVKKYLGNYISDEGIDLGIEIKHSKLYYKAGDENNPLVQESDNLFSMLYAPEVKFNFNIVGKDTTIEVNVPNETIHLKKYTKIQSPDDKTLQKYTGKYYCPELDCSYSIILKDQSLFLTNAKYNDAKLKLAGAEHLLNDNWWINHIVVTRNASNQITGFEVNSGRIMHLRFNKIE